MHIVALTGHDRGWPALVIESLIAHDSTFRFSVVLATSSPQSRKKRIKRILRKITSQGPDVVLGGAWLRRRLAKVTSVLPSLRETCNAHQIPVHERKWMNDPETTKFIQGLAPDVVLSLGNGWLSKGTYSSAKIAALNVHHELLPEFAGAPPVIHSLAAGRRETGFSIHELTPQIDGGPIIFRRVVPISFSTSLATTIEKTTNRLYQDSAEALFTVLSNYRKGGGKIQSDIIGVKQRYTTPTLRDIFRAWQVWNKERAQNGKEVR